jgi:DNA-directed RNA polymerase subunit RPC12/RpoP
MAWKVNSYSNVVRPGVYRCTTCDDNHLSFEEGEEAPTCDNCNHRPVTWEYVRPRRIGFSTEPFER